MDMLVAVVLTDVNFMTNTPIITDQAEKQRVYEGYSNVGWRQERRQSESFILNYASSYNPSSSSWMPLQAAQPS